MMDAQTRAVREIVEAERHVGPVIQTIVNQFLDPSTAGGCESAASDRRGRMPHVVQLLGYSVHAPDGASVEEIVAAFDWQPTVRGAIAGALKKRLGLQIGSEAIEAADASTA